MTDLRVLRLAQRDLDDIETYSRTQFGKERTRAYLIALRAAIRGLRDLPEAAPAAADLAPGIRAVRSGSHRIFYRYANGEVTVLRILHHAMDVTRWLG